MSVAKYIIRRNQYYDSVFLMGINKGLMSASGVIQSAVLMGTQNNKQLLADINISGFEIEKAEANDLIIAVIAETEQFAESALDMLDPLLSNVQAKPGQVNLRTLDDAIHIKPNANLAVISVPGEFAAREARTALEKGLNVFLFSSNVSVEDELKLKNLSREKNLLVMGPDCGTSIIGGKGIGFANRVLVGPVGVIGPSGTGLQEFTCLIHHLGSGISHAIGTGSRDLKDDIGGITTLMALDLLEKDVATEVVAIVSKPAGKKTLVKILNRLDNFNKPIITCFLGVEKIRKSKNKNLKFTSTIDDAAQITVSNLDINPAQIEDDFAGSLLEEEAKSYAPKQKYIRGLFAGGTFCYQSQQLLLASGLDIHSNDPLVKAEKLRDPDKSIGHTLVDMGDEYYTLGKPHPMIDGTMRSLRISNEAEDPEVAIILLDFILGFNASNDPVGEAIESILAVKRKTEKQGRHITFVASITGTEDDIQDLNLQRKMLKDAGVLVTFSNAAATRLCSQIMKMRDQDL